MKTLSLIASTKPTAEFIEAATGADVTTPSSEGKSLLMSALSNGDPESRYATTQWLLDRGCPLGAPNSEGYTELHVLFGQAKHDVSSALAIAKHLIAIGADVNAVSARGGLVFCEVLMMKYSDEDLEPLYKLWFEQPVTLDFETPSTRGATPLEYARAVPFRTSILERMERYVAEHS